ncbi:glycosyltransferase family 2 protein [Halobacteriaceae archaeon SHR40]|uniref:glycosyltransferase family 2 protein n=1 Tax=Halovenus amylolytica TaxID=2500550 RepID=UPI000FE36DC0
MCRQADELPEVGIVIVNWNNYDDTARCLESLSELSYPSYQVVVVDNGSTDESGERLKKEFEWCDVVFNDTNEGFGGGCNTGIGYALANDVEFVLLLNNDAVVAPDTLDELVTVSTEANARVVGASITHGCSDVVNSSPSKYPDMFFYSGYRENLPVSYFPKKSPDHRWWQTDRVEGGGVLLASDLLRERKETAGHYIDDSLFMYCEEIELAMWCRERDETAVIASDAHVKHDTDASSSRAFQLYYLTRNRVLVGDEHLRGAGRLLFESLYPVTRVLLAARFLWWGQRDVATAILRGLVDGYRGIEGQTR